MKCTWLYLSVSILLSACSFQPKASWVTTSEDALWQEQPDLVAVLPDTVEEIDVTVFPDVRKQEIMGFGVGFNELDWICLSRLDPTMRQNVLEELFYPDYGGNFSICHLPIGANDFAKDWYSYDETEQDTTLIDFTISNDNQTLIPFIKSVQKFNSDLNIISSPWSPPLWIRDSLQTDSVYMESYAKYFLNYLTEYSKQGITVNSIMPQQNWDTPSIESPSYQWNPNNLSTFIGQYLGPTIESQKVDIILGSMYELNKSYIDSIMNDSICKPYIQGIGFDLAEAKTIKEIHSQYPNLILYQTESGNNGGKNSWNDAITLWNKLYRSFANGVSAFIYPNIALEVKSLNKWAQARNSLVLVDSETQSYNYTPEYFMIRHFSHYIQSGAYRIATTGTFTKLLAFINPDDTIVIIVANQENKGRRISMKIGKEIYQPELPPMSMSTIFIE